MRLIPLAAVLVAAIVAAPASAKTIDVDITPAFVKELPKVKAKTVVPVLLPDAMPFEDIKLFATGHARQTSWRLDLAGGRNCREATACFVAEFGAERHGKLFGSRKVRLRDGRTGSYEPLSGARAPPPPTTRCRRAWPSSGRRRRSPAIREWMRSALRRSKLSRRSQPVPAAAIDAHLHQPRPHRDGGASIVTAIVALRAPPGGRAPR
jgi:hypothetical protein